MGVRLIVQTPGQLRELYQVEPVGPFGLLVTARKHRDLRNISGLLLEDLFTDWGLVIFRGFDPLGKESLLDFCLEYPNAELLQWESGPVMEMTPASEAKNYLFSREAVPLHWDGAFHREPSYLVFHCLQAPDPNGGGETVFTDTNRVWGGATAADRERWANTRITYKTDKVAHYGGSITVDLVQRHPKSGAPILRFAEPVETKLNPVTVEVDGAGPELLSDLARRFHEKPYHYVHRWEDGDYLIADNHRLVHGRNAFAKESPRHLRRIQIL